MPRLGIMHEEVSVLLLSVGESPGELKVELERLGVNVLECEFPDAEEKIMDAAPDLVVLLGARGAMELATLLDDQEGDHRPRMVIVAARKDLARLRGLNREVVISLFALETTEKVVGQRVESLARRAARRRTQAGAPLAPAAKSTSLGLPSAQAILGHLNLKRVAAPSPPGISIREPDQPDAVSEKAPPAQPRLESPTVPSQEDVLVLDEDLLSLPPSQPPDGNSQLERMPATPGLPAIDMFGETGADSSNATSSPPISIPPTLPPAAKEKSSPRTSLAKQHKSLNDDEMDISDAEKALENLDSSKAEITASLLKDAQEYLAEAKTAATPAKSAVVEQDREVGHADVESSAAARAEEDDGVADVEAAIDNLGSTVVVVGALPPGPNPPAVDVVDEGSQTSASDAVAHSSEESDDGGLEATSAAKSLPDREEPTADRRPDVVEPAEVVGIKIASGALLDEQTNRLASPDTGTAEPRHEEVQSSLEPSVTPELMPSPQAKSGKGGWGLLLVAGAVLGLGGAYYLGLLGPSTRSATHEPRAAAEPQHPEGSQITSKAPTSEGPAFAPPPTAQPTTAPPPTAPPTTAETTEVPSGEVPEVNGDATAAPSRDNPFLVVDAGEPACESLVTGEKVAAEKDPVYQASVVWQEAREMIVAGKLKDANVKMCEAVALNPESAAVEGLAALYLRLKSPKQALKWVDRAEELRPGQSEMGYVRGDIYSLLGRNQEARAVWLKTLNIPEEDLARIEAVSRDYSVEAGRHLRRGDLVRADQWFRRAATLDPKNVAGIIGLAKTFYRAGDTAHARAFCEMSLSVSDEIPEVHVMLGELALADGDKAGARVRFERALAIRPDFFPAKRGLSQVK